MAGVSGHGQAEVDRDAPAVELLRAALTGFLQAMDDNQPGVLADGDPEALHDFRVAVRRTRATLKLGRPALPDDVRDRWEPELKWLGTLTTPVRDLDIVQLALPTMSGWLVAADVADLAPLATHLNRRRAAEREALLRGFESERFARLRWEWGETVDRLTPSSPDSGGQPMSVGELAGRSITRAGRRALRAGADIQADSPAADLHALRKRCKELRYVLEVFSPVLEKTPRKRVVKDLTGLQDVLGRFQDAEVQLRVLRGFAEAEAGEPAAAAGLAVGELIGLLVGVQEAARRELDATFGGFARPGSVRRLRSLT